MKRFRFIVVAGLAFQANLPATFAAHPPPVIFTGAQSQITERGQFRLSSAQEFAKLWLRHMGKEVKAPYDFYYNRAEVPEVDFERFMVIAVFAGSGMNCAGFKGLEVVDEPTELIIRMDQKSYQSRYPGDPSSAYAFFVVAKSAKPVLLQTDQRDLGQRARNAPPAWGDYARLPGEVKSSASKPAPPAFAICLSNEPETPLITDKDIISYDFSKHSMRLFAAVMARLPKVPVSGRPFDVMVNGERIYTGRFVSPRSSMTFNEPVICMGMETVTLTIDPSYPGEILPRTTPDLRPDERIRKALAALHKLDEKKGAER